MKLRGEPIRKKVLRSNELAITSEEAPVVFFDYHKGLSPESRQAVEDLARFFVRDLSSMRAPMTGQEPFGASLFLQSVEKVPPVDTTKVMEVAKEWKKLDESMFPDRKGLSRLAPEWFRTVAEFINLNPDTRVLFQDRIEQQREFLSPQALAQTDGLTMRTHVLPAMVLYPEHQAELLALQDQWAQGEIKRLEKTLRGGHYVQDAEFWRLIDDILTAPDYLRDWQRIIGQYMRKQTEGMKDGIKPKEPGEPYYPGEINLAYEILVLQLLNGLKMHIDYLGKVSLESRHPHRAANQSLPERAVA